MKAKRVPVKVYYRYPRMGELMHNRKHPQFEGRREGISVRVRHGVAMVEVED